MLRRFLILSALFLLAACNRGGPGGFFGPDKPAVSVEKVLSEEKQAVISVSATLQPAEKVEIQFPMDVRADQIAVNLGDNVNAGDLLFRLNETDFNLHLAQLKTQKLEQEALLDKNTYFLNNRDRLLSEGKIDQAMHDSIEAEVKAIQAKLETLRTDIALVENQVRQVAVNAPFAGQVTAKNITAGIAAPARQNLLTLIKADPMHVLFSLPASQAGAITNGATLKVRVEDFGDRIFPAAVIFVNPELKSGDHTVEVRATLSNPQHTFKGGMNAQAEFTSPQKARVLSVPSKAVLNETNRDYVYIVKNNRAWRVRVYTRKESENPERTEILEGLTDKDIVVTGGQDKLREGVEVNLWR